MTPKLPKPPDSLRADGAGEKFWLDVQNAFDVVDPHHMKLLENACIMADRAESAREAIAKDGITTLNRFGEVREHPATVVERASMTSFRQAVREMGLSIDIPEPTRGPQRPGTRK